MPSSPTTTPPSTYSMKIYTVVAFSTIVAVPLIIETKKDATKIETIVPIKISFVIFALFPISPSLVPIPINAPITFIIVNHIFFTYTISISL